MAYASLLDRLGLQRRELRAWAYYDVANSAWMTTVMTAVFPSFFVALATAAGLSDPVARSRFAFASSVSVVLVGFSGPVIGAIADLRGSKKVPGGVRGRGGGRDRRHGLHHLRPLDLRPRDLRAGQGGGHLQPRVLQRAPARGRPAGRGRPRLDRRLRAGLPGRRPPPRGEPRDDRRPGAVPPARRGRGRPLLLLQRGGVARPLLDPALPTRRGAEAAPRRERVRRRERRARGRAAARRDPPRAAPHRDAGLLLLAFLVYNDAVNTIIAMGTTCTEARSGCRSPA